MAWAKIEFLTPQAKISCPRGFATWARIFAFGVKNSILALAIGWESYIFHTFFMFWQITQNWMKYVTTYLFLKNTEVKHTT